MVVGLIYVPSSHQFPGVLCLWCLFVCFFPSFGYIWLELKIWDVFGKFVCSFQMTHSHLRPEASAGCQEAAF